MLFAFTELAIENEIEESTGEFGLPRYPENNNLRSRVRQLQNMLDEGRLTIRIGLPIFWKLLRQLYLDSHILLGHVRMVGQVISKEQVSLPSLTRYFIHMDVQSPRITLDKIVSPRNPKFTFVLIPQMFNGLDTDHRLFKIPNRDGDIDDRFGDHAWNRGAADMLNIQYLAAETRLKDSSLFLEKKLPGDGIRIKSYDAIGQANTVGVWNGHIMWHINMEKAPQCQGTSIPTEEPNLELAVLSAAMSKRGI
jgi:hypothetical protein